MAENPEQQATSGAGESVIDPEVSPIDIRLKIEDKDLATEVHRGAGFRAAASDVARNIARSIPTEPQAFLGAFVFGAAVGAGAGVATATVVAAAAEFANRAINYFWSENNDKVEKAVRKALEKGTVNPDPQVIEIPAGSLLVKLRCHTPRSFLQFVSDYESQKVKRRLEEELSAVGFRKELTIDIKNKEEVEEKNKKLRYVSFIC